MKIINEALPSAATEAPVAIETLSQPEDSSRLVARAALRVATLLEGGSRKAEEFSYKAAERRTGNELLTDKLGELGDALTPHVEKGVDTFLSAKNKAGESRQFAKTYARRRLGKAGRASTRGVVRVVTSPVRAARKVSEAAGNATEAAWRGLDKWADEVPARAARKEQRKASKAQQKQVERYQNEVAVREAELLARQRAIHRANQAQARKQDRRRKLEKFAENTVNKGVARARKFGKNTIGLALDVRDRANVVRGNAQQRIDNTKEHAHNAKQGYHKTATRAAEAIARRAAKKAEQQDDKIENKSGERIAAINELLK